MATRVFASADTEPSMRAIAREAGVGIATLYRHFPTRESLADALALGCCVLTCLLWRRMKATKADYAPFTRGTVS